MMLAAVATPLGLPWVQVDAAAEEEVQPSGPVDMALVRPMSCQPGPLGSHGGHLPNKLNMGGWHFLNKDIGKNTGLKKWIGILV